VARLYGVRDGRRYRSSYYSDSAGEVGCLASLFSSFLLPLVFRLFVTVLLASCCQTRVVPDSSRAYLGSPLIEECPLVDSFRNYRGNSHPPLRRLRLGHKSDARQFYSVTLGLLPGHYTRPQALRGISQSASIMRNIGGRAQQWRILLLEGYSVLIYHANVNIVLEPRNDLSLAR